MTRRKTAAPRPGPFKGRQHALSPEASVDLDGKFWMIVPTLEGAHRLATLLNEAIALAAEAHLFVENPGDNAERLAQGKIAYAVATALGGGIDHESFALPYIDPRLSISERVRIRFETGKVAA